eukprot:comp21471_c0_seq1/m.29723 comp21471_c0_seq1/g.29723  ORF comp21471_c0_seq1/g.29723 comp21471_c0_seq1/m.29723 type:complete len:309 (-) comp21471_c0_seq1:195-1121(-)
MGTLVASGTSSPSLPETLSANHITKVSSIEFSTECSSSSAGKRKGVERFNEIFEESKTFSTLARHFPRTTQAFLDRLNRKEQERILREKTSKKWIASAVPARSCLKTEGTFARSHTCVFSRQVSETFQNLSDGSESTMSSVSSTGSETTTTSAPTPGTPTTLARVSFNEEVVVEKAYSKSKYVRKGYGKTKFKTRKDLEDLIEEIRKFKTEEMEVHPESRIYTHFYKPGKFLKPSSPSASVLASDSVSCDSPKEIQENVLPENGLELSDVSIERTSSSESGSSEECPCEDGEEENEECPCETRPAESH